MKFINMLFTGLMACECCSNIYDENGRIREEVRQFAEDNNVNLAPLDGENGPY